MLNREKTWVTSGALAGGAHHREGRALAAPGSRRPVRSWIIIVKPLPVPRPGTAGGAMTKILRFLEGAAHRR